MLSRVAKVMGVWEALRHTSSMAAGRVCKRFAWSRQLAQNSPAIPCEGYMLSLQLPAFLCNVVEFVQVTIKRASLFIGQTFKDTHKRFIRTFYRFFSVSILLHTKDKNNLPSIFMCWSSLLRRYFQVYCGTTLLTRQGRHTLFSGVKKFSFS